jgi:hypothetical protein
VIGPGLRQIVEYAVVPSVIRNAGRAGSPDRLAFRIRRRPIRIHRDGRDRECVEPRGLLLPPVVPGALAERENADSDPRRRFSQHDANQERVSCLLDAADLSDRVRGHGALANILVVAHLEGPWSRIPTSRYFCRRVVFRQVELRPSWIGLDC